MDVHNIDENYRQLNEMLERALSQIKNEPLSEKTLKSNQSNDCKVINEN